MTYKYIVIFVLYRYFSFKNHSPVQLFTMIWIKKIIIFSTYWCMFSTNSSLKYDVNFWSSWHIMFLSKLIPVTGEVINDLNIIMNYRITDVVQFSQCNQCIFIIIEFTRNIKSMNTFHYNMALVSFKLSTMITRCLNMLFLQFLCYIRIYFAKTFDDMIDRS